VLLLYHFLVHLYPATYRGEYGEEMLAVLSEVLTENQKKGVMARIVSAVCEIAGLLCGALREHIRNIAGSIRVEKSFSRRVTMRSDFRFPKTTVTLMALVLLAVFLAIEKGKDIQASIAYANPQVGPIHPTQQLALLPTLLLVLAFACLMGAFGWAMLFALRRTGSQRLSNVDVSSRPGCGTSLSI